MVVVVVHLVRPEKRLFSGATYCWDGKFWQEVKCYFLCHLPLNKKAIIHKYIMHLHVGTVELALLSHVKKDEGN